MQNEVYKRYKKETNLTCSKMKKWAKEPCSKKASLDRRPLRRNIRLLCNPQSKWTKKDFKEAKKSISYLKRAKKIKSKNKVKDCNMTKNQIALKNWGYDALR